MKPAYWLFGSHQTILADASTTEGRYDYTLSRHESGLQTPLHKHAFYSEHLFVLEGEYTVWVGDAVVVLRPGEDCFIPVGVVHTIKATGPGTSRGLNVSVPSGFVRFMTTIGIPDNGDGPPPPASPDPEMLARLLAEIGDEILGPPGALPGGTVEIGKINGGTEMTSVN